MRRWIPAPRTGIDMSTAEEGDRALTLGWLSIMRRWQHDQNAPSTY
ncbi:hypothetical protein AS9A_3071 [Hoyosella subflava DQS3-9A1]|uniref:Uncharacterized protein n=1 Tax=Hoyosella subflava (strain DSM 45089 / JCM 17490 / NBRC 109087 / DQS3-9A1) TaxID=443218 RepID=F6ELR8_HOYSD|nr:hypothetical protein AS9A_3071 [Hoyosella subflava DQS3-9A1]